MLLDIFTFGAHKVLVHRQEVSEPLVLDVTL